MSSNAITQSCPVYSAKTESFLSAEVLPLNAAAENPSLLAKLSDACKTLAGVLLLGFGVFAGLRFILWARAGHLHQPTIDLAICSLLACLGFSMLRHQFRHDDEPGEEHADALRADLSSSEESCSAANDQPWSARIQHRRAAGM